MNNNNYNPIHSMGVSKLSLLLMVVLVFIGVYGVTVIGKILKMDITLDDMGNVVNNKDDGGGDINGQDDKLNKSDSNGGTAIGWKEITIISVIIIFVSIVIYKGTGPIMRKISDIGNNEKKINKFMKKIIDRKKYARIYEVMLNHATQDENFALIKVWENGDVNDVETVALYIQMNEQWIGKDIHKVEGSRLTQETWETFWELNEKVKDIMAKQIWFNKTYSKLRKPAAIMEEMNV